MYKRFLFFLTLLAIVTQSNAQLSMTLQTPPTGVLLKKQLWNVAIIYTGEIPLSLKLNLTLSDASTGQVVLTAETSSFSIEKGAHQMQSSDFSVINYNYLSSLITDHDPDGYLSAGSFEACFTLLSATDIHEAPIANECANFEVEPLSPVVLNSPVDGDTLQTLIPQFTWLPPTPLNIFNNLSYYFNVVEVQQGQAPADALQQNISVYGSHNVNDVFLNYPSSSVSLEAGKQYAWQVIAESNNQPVSRSEVWSFWLAQTILPVKDINQDPFVRLTRQQTGSISACEGSVKFVYQNDLGDSTVTYQITPVDEGTEDVARTGELRLKFGENFIELPFLDNNRLMNNATYLLELVNSKNESWSMKFNYHDPEQK